MTTMPSESGPGPLLSGTAGRRIRGLRAELGLSQSELVMLTRKMVSRSGLSDRESGVKPVPLDELPVFAAVLGVSVAYLMGFTDDRSRPLEEAASEVVRHQGLEPRTRWLSEASDTTAREPRLRIFPGPPIVVEPVGDPEPAPEVAVVVSLDTWRSASRRAVRLGSRRGA